MRCPKCGYISFDHMESCRKCKKDISGTADVEGTTYHASAPSFLRVPEKNTADPVEENMSALQSNDEIEGEFEFSDPDLDILVDDDENGATITFGEADIDNGDFLLEPEDESDEDGTFEFELDDDTDSSDDVESIAAPLNVPDELSDISDLAPPEEGDGPIASVSSDMSLSLDDETSLDEELDLDGLDLDLGLGGDKKVADSDMSLSLDDIDLSPGDLLEETSELDSMSLDLSLDEIEAAPASEDKKSSGSLDGISLSLD